jgi:protease II
MTGTFPFGPGSKPVVPVPKAEKVEKILEQFGEKRNDPWYWLRSDSRDDEKVDNR